MSRRILPLGLALLLPLVLAAPAVTEEKPVEEMWEFSTGPEGMPLEKLIAMVREDTGESILYNLNDPMLKNRRVFFPGSYQVPRSRIFDWFRSVLSYQKLVLVPSGPEGHGQWLLVAMNDPAVCYRPTYVEAKDLPEWKDRDGAYVVSVIEFEHLADTTRARNALANLVSRSMGRVNDVPGGRSLVVGDFAPVVHAMWKLAKAMDVEPRPAPVATARAKANPAAARVAAPATARRGELERYESMLVGCRTDAAAGYFLERIRELRASEK